MKGAINNRVSKKRTITLEILEIFMVSPFIIEKIISAIKAPPTKNIAKILVNMSLGLR